MPFCAVEGPAAGEARELAVALAIPAPLETQVGPAGTDTILLDYVDAGSS
jgi:hypothetical protein